MKVANMGLGLVLLLMLCGFVTCQEQNKDGKILASIKKAIIDDPHTMLGNWDTTTSHCQWKGVRCNGESRVVGLDLSSMDISSPFPKELIEMDSLIYVNLSNNVFMGELPNNFSKLASLHSLDLYNNNLTGPLPLSLSPSLQHLDLGGNYLSGTIPKEYGERLKSLHYLGLHGNSLYGKIPSQLGLLENLRTLKLGYFNVFSGSIPKEIGNLKNLETLDIANCSMSGRIPLELGKLKKLQVMFLQTNAINGPIPRELGGLTSLSSLDLSNNELLGEIPKEFNKLASLRLLNLFINKLHGEVPRFLGDLPSLEVLQLWQNNFTGSLPQNLGLNGKLMLLDVSTNKLIGRIPLNLCRGNKLKILVLMNNFFMGPIPESLGYCLSMVRLRMGQNYLNGSIPKGLLYLPQLSFIELPGNLLSGEIFAKGNSMSRIGHMDLSNNALSGSLPWNIGNFTRLSKLDLSNNLLVGEIPSDIRKCEALTYVDFSRNQLTGQIPQELATMKKLDYLNVSRNYLSGNISLQFSKMQSLTSADFSYNNLSGPIPEVGQFAFFNASAFAGNPALCGPSLAHPCKRSQENVGNTDSSKAVKLALLLGLILCCAIVSLAASFKARNIWRKLKTSKAWKLTIFQKVEFTTEDVLECVKDDNLIGRGGAGVVYHGVLPNGEEVAVKKLTNNICNKGSGSSNDYGFAAEIGTLGNIRHRNIVRLVAFCSNSSDTNLLVYEYMPNGNLGEILHGTKGAHLHWQTRYKIALDAAKGLCYLHHDCTPMIIHRDVKSSNILLDSNFEAHVADFGLAKFLVSSDTMSAVAGSYGYIAPEYAYTLKVDEKSDVYSFGVVMLELITGKKAVGEFGEGVNIVQWVRKTTGGAREGVKKIIDVRLSSVPLDEAMHMFFVAMLCVEDYSVQRPTMREVVQMLQEAPKSTPRQYFSPSSHNINSKEASPIKPPSSIPPPPPLPPPPPPTHLI